MNIDKITYIKNHKVEFMEEEHVYLVDGVPLPSITQILKLKFGGKYKNVDSETLKKASDKGTEMHKAIENYEKYHIEQSNLKELSNYLFLKKHYKWEVLHSEIMCILFIQNIPVAVGTIDQIIKIDDKKGVNDLKRTAVFDKEYVAYQTTLYKIAYEQSYDEKIDFISGTYLREDTRKFYKLPLNEEVVKKIIIDYLEEE